MSAEIKAGDLVAVVRQTPCGCDTGSFGLIRRAIKIYHNTGMCRVCGASQNSLGADLSGPSLHSEHQPWFIALSRLKKIDPPALPAETQAAETQADEGVSA